MDRIARAAALLDGEVIDFDAPRQDPVQDEVTYLNAIALLSCKYIILIHSNTFARVGFHRVSRASSVEYTAIKSR